MPTLARPDVDVLEGLTTAIIVDQGAWARTPARPSAPPPMPMRCCILFSRLGEPHVGSQAFSFNVASVSGALGRSPPGEGNRTVKGTPQLPHHRGHVPAL